MEGIGEMAQMVKYLLCKPESLIVILKPHVRTIAECAGKHF